MSNPEGLSSSNGESAGETPRAVNQERGKKTEAQLEAERKEKIEQYKKLDEYYYNIMNKHLEELKEIIGGESSSAQPDSEAPKTETRGIDTFGTPAAETSSASAASSVERAPASEKSPEKVNEAKNGQKKNSALKNLVRSAAIGAAVLSVAFGVTMTIANNKANTVNLQVLPAAAAVVKSVPSTVGLMNEKGEVLPYGELTGIGEFDKSVDGSLTQFDNIGMTDTKKHTDDNPNVGKFSDYSNAAPNDLAREYFGVEKFDDLSLEDKVTCHSMACYKQDFCAMHILNVIDPEYKNMSFDKAVMTLREGDQSVKDEKIGMISDFFKNATPSETTVGDLAKGFSVMPGAEEITKWLETQADGTLVENETTVKDVITSTHTYSINHDPVKQTVATPDSAKVLEYTYSVSETEEVSIYVLERCFNGFIITKTTDKTTKQTKLTVTFFGEEDKIEQKDVQNAIKSFEEQAKKESEERGFDKIVEYVDTNGPDGTSTEAPMEVQPDLPQPSVNPAAEEAVPVNPGGEADYSEDVNKPTTPDQPEKDKEANEKEMKEDETPHQEDIGDKSVDELLNM